MNEMKRVLAVLLALTIAFSATACGKKEKPAAAPIAVETVKENTVEAFGVVKASDIHNVNLGFIAAVAKVAAKEGQKIKKGDILMTLDLQDYLAEISAKEHDLNAVRLEIKKLQSKLLEADTSKSKDPDVRKLINDVAFAKQEYDKMMREYVDKQELFNSGAISKYELEEFNKALQAKKKANLDLEYSLEMTTHDKQLGNTEISANMAIQAEKAAALEREIAAMKDKLSKSYMNGENIVSDVDNGVVFDLGYQAGDIISTSKKAMSIMNLDGMIVRANVSEEFIKDVKLGAKVNIIPVADKSKQYTGVVTLIANKAEVQNGETVIPVEISIDNNDGFLMPEYNVDVEIQY